MGGRVEGLQKERTSKDRIKRTLWRRRQMERLARRLARMPSLHEGGDAFAQEAWRLFGHDALLLDLLDTHRRRLWTIHCEDTPEGYEHPVSMRHWGTRNAADEVMSRLRVGSWVVNRPDDEPPPQRVPFGLVKRTSRSLIFACMEYLPGYFLRVTVQSYTPGRYNRRDARVLQCLLMHACQSIVGLKNAQELAHGKERFERTAISTGNVIYEADLDTGMVHYAGDIDSLMGYEPGEFPRTVEGWLSRVHPDDLERLKPEWDRLKNRGDWYAEQYRIRHKDGTYRHWISQGGVWLEGDLTPSRIFGALSDVTDKVHEREALQTAETTYRSLVEQSLVGFNIQQNGRYYYVNPQFASMLGYTAEELHELEDVMVLVDEADRETLQAYAESCLASPERCGERITARLVRRDGSRIVVETIASRIEVDGEPALLVTTVDVTDRENAARERDAFNEVLLELSGADTFEKVSEIVASCVNDLWNPDVMLLLARVSRSQVFHALTGHDTINGEKVPIDVEPYPLAPDYLSTKPWADRAILTDRSRKSDGEIQLIPFGAEDHTSQSMLHAPIRVGEEIVGMITVQSYESGAFNAFDLRLLERLAELLGPNLARCRVEAQSRQLAWALEQASDGVDICDADERLVYVNRAWCTMTGRQADDVMGMRPRDLNLPITWDPEEEAEIDRSLAENGTWSGVWRSRRADGTEFDEHVAISPLLDSAGNITHTFAMRRDITRELTLEANARQAEKMESVGMLASGISHDFNNILQIIMGIASNAITKLDADDPLRAELDNIIRQANRSATLIAQLLAFSRRQKLKPRDLPLNKAVNDTLRNLRVLVREDIELIVMTHADPDRVFVDPTQIEQILMNLATNARDAMVTGGRLYISTSGPLPLPPEVGAETDPDDLFVALEVADTGEGIAPEVLSKILEPFFTTKPLGSGTGMGLPTVYGIVKQSGGHMTIDSTVGEGTVFTIYLPRSSEAESNQTPPPDETEPPRGNETILLAEDEIDLAKVVRSNLQWLGYNVLRAGNGVEALQILDEWTGPIHLLLTDVIMPQMGGVELAQKVRLRHPQMPVIFLTGYADVVSTSLAEQQEGSVYLQKPLQPDRLAVEVRALLDASK